MCNRTASQDRDSAIPNSHDCRLNAMLCRSGIDDQWDASVEFIQHVLRCCRTDTSKSVCTWGSERLIQFTHDFSKHRMRTESHRHCIQSRCYDVRNDVALWKNDREWPRPKFVDHLADQLLIARWHIDNSLEPLAIRQVNNERVEARPFLDFKNFRDGNRVQRLSGKSVNSFRWQRDNVALPQKFNRRNAVG